MKTRSVRYHLLFLFSITLIIRNAYIAEDAFIYVRYIDNFFEGYGLRWNVAERVQAFTSPLWMLTLIIGGYLCRFFTTEAFWTAQFVSLLVACITLFFSCKAASKKTWLSYFFVFFVLGSHSFTSYLSSGLENGLMIWLLGLCVQRSLKFSRTWQVSSEDCFLFGLLLLVRHDLLLCILPLIFFAFWRIAVRYSALEAIKKSFFFLVPLILNSLACLVYYGSPLPNTYFSKLANATSFGSRILSGFAYVIGNIHHDFCSVFVIICALIAITYSGTRVVHKLWMYGVLTHLLFLIGSVGGDYMIGRFLCAAVSVSFFVLATHRPINVVLRPQVSLIALLGAIITIYQYQSPLLFPRTLKVEREPYVSLEDEKSNRFLVSSLLVSINNPEIWKSSGWSKNSALAIANGERVAVMYNIGLSGAYARSALHIVDQNALTDFILARLPPKQLVGVGVGRGHNTREIPPCYLEFLKGSRSLSPLKSSDTTVQYLKLVKALIAEPVWSLSRLKTVILYQLGSFKEIQSNAFTSIACKSS